ncbi:MAG: serine/threonine protein kinase [Pirellulaceae bacterium]|nr:MAG: serine/threonine protein kinase [Pirellulaceae bacterium]
MSQSPIPTPETARDPDLSGRRLGDYELIRRLGRGGMADVYLAKQLSLGRNVAIKILRGHLAADPTYVRRFQQEARAAASLVHANIVQIHEVGQIDGLYYIVQEYVPGQNLRQYLQKHGPLDAKTAARVIRHVTAALHRSAQQNIVHRDIKPENIMLSVTGEVKVADFGLARVTQEGQAIELTQVGVTLGTPLYMSPEQVEGRPVDPRSDIYSLGVTCYHMLAGRPPFEGDSPLSVAVQHLQSDPVRLETLRPDLPPELCAIVHRMMAKNPADRYQKPVEILRDLRALKLDDQDLDTSVSWDMLAEGADVATAVSLSAATQQLAAVLTGEKRAARRIRRLALAAVLLVPVGFVAGGWWAWQHHRPLLEPSDSPQTTIKRMESARAQYFYACLEGSEAALKSVEQYFPPHEGPENRLYVRRAWQRLAELYLMRGDLDLALETYRKLAEQVEDTEEYFRAVGLAGQAVALFRLGRKSEAAEKLAQAVPLMERLLPLDRQNLFGQLDPDLREELRRLLSESSSVRPALPSGVDQGGPIPDNGGR